MVFEVPKAGESPKPNISSRLTDLLAKHGVAHLAAEDMEIIREVEDLEAEREQYEADNPGSHAYISGEQVQSVDPEENAHYYAEPVKFYKQATAGGTMELYADIPDHHWPENVSAKSGTGKGAGR